MLGGKEGRKGWEIELLNLKTEMTFPDLWRRAVDFLQERNGMNDLDVGPICSC